MEATLSIPHQYVGQAGNVISRFLTVTSGLIESLLLLLHLFCCCI